MFDINNLQIKSNINAMQLEEAINKIKQDNKLKGLGTAFINVENKYNVNAIILASIACLESGYGTSRLAIEKNNLFGLDAPLSTTGTDNYGSGYKSKEECIDYACHRIGKQYLELDAKASWRYCEGKKDIYAVGAKWCEVKGWSDKVISIANRIEKNINGGNSMKILISAGHTLTGKGTGAVGFINESQENRVLAKFVVENLKKLGHEVDYHEVNSGSDYIEQQAKKANSKNYDLVVQIHFNSSDNATANGTEVIYRSSKGKVFAQKVQDKLKTEFKDRKIKHDINHLKRDLGWLRLTNPPAILIETCFVSNKADTDKYTSNREKIAKLIAEGIANQTIVENSNSSASSTDKKLYAVCVTACEYNSAKKMQQELINKGYKDTYLIPR